MFEIPYGLLPVVAVVWLTYQHTETSPASDRAKGRLILFATLAVLVAAVWPIVGVVLQVSACSYVLLYRTITSDANRAGNS